MAIRILIIDDEELITKSLLKFLTKEGYQVTVTKSGQEGLEQVKKNTFDLIISDVRMPEMDGIQTIQRIRDYLKEANKKLAPEIIITGYADAEKYEKALQLKVADYLYKPFDREELLRVIKKNSMSAK